MDNNFLQSYLETVAERTTNVSVIISFLFWTVGVVYEACTFVGSLADIMLIVTGTASTVFLVLFPSSQHVYRLLKKDDVARAKRVYLGEVCSTIHYFGLLWIWTGFVIVLGDYGYNCNMPYAIIPELFGIAGVFVLIFCPTEEHFR